MAWLKLCQSYLQLATLVQVQSADIGVITPYKAMAHLLQGKLASIASCRDTKVNTVDAFQGQEKRVRS